MLYIDGISLQKIKEELKENLLGKRINRIFKNNEFSISLYFGKIELLFSCLPSFSICYLSKNKEKPILDIDSSFISNLRKNLMNASLSDITQLGFDRILVFHFMKIDELGTVKKFKIYFECIGKQSNIFFTNADDIIIDLLRRNSLGDSERVLFKGSKYERYNFKEKLNPSEIEKEAFNIILNKNNIVEKIEGIGKVLEKNILNYEQFKKILSADTKCSKIFVKDKKIILATVLDIDLKDYDELLSFNTFDEMINFYLKNNLLSSSFSILKSRLLAQINRKIKKFKNILDLIDKDIEEVENLEKIKQKADILSSILFTLKRGMSQVETFDFYNECMIVIELDPRLSPKENIENIYKKYSKTKRKIENAKRRKVEINSEVEYLENIITYIENSNEVISLREIEEELIEEKYIKVFHKTKKTKLKKEIKYGMLEINGTKILYGRNNLENDNLSFKIANKEDFWFHAKDIPSSHVIVKTEILTDEIIKKAAEIAAYYTKININEKVSIDYTQKKYINKPKHSKLGFVTYTHQKNIVVKKVEI